MVNYTQEDGLNASYIYMLSQDKEGYIWIGSDNGLFRFDGVEFKNYNKKNGLKNTEVLQAIPISNGEVFIASFISDFAYLKNDSIYGLEIKSTRTNKDFESRYIINKDHTSGNIFIYEDINPKDVFVFDGQTIHRKNLGIKPDDTLLQYSIVQFKDSLVVYGRNDVVGSSALFRLNPNSGKLNSLKCSINPRFGRYYTLNDDYFALLSEKEVQIFNGIETPAKTIRFSRNVYWVRMSGKEKLWVSFTDGGIAYFDLSKDPDMRSPLVLMNDFILTDVMVDKDNNVWFATKNEGLFFISKKNFENHAALLTKNSSSYIAGITSNDRSVIIVYNTGKASVLTNNTQQDFILDKNPIYSNCLILANEKMAIFSLGNTSYKLDFDSKKIKELNVVKSHYKNIVPFTKESVLFCTANFLIEYNFVKNISTEIARLRTYAAVSFDKDSLFVGSFKDLYKFNTITKSKTLFLKGYYFTDLKKLDKGIYLGATNGNGLIIFDRNGIKRKITSADGLASDQIKRLDLENESTCWASTNLGLCRIQFKGKSLDISNFTRQDGLFSERISGCVIRRDTAYVGTAKGLSVIPVKDLLNQPDYIFKTVEVNYVIIGGKKHIRPTTKLSATFPDNNVTFHLSFLDYASLGKVSYLYKIEGLNKEWQTSNSPKILLNALPPGDYVFKVFGVSYNGKQTYKYTTVAFEINPQFWQTLWFQIIAAVFASALLFGGINTFVQRRRNKKLKALVYEKKIAELELQAIKAQINPHFIYNCLNSIQFLLYKKDYTETENYLETFAVMIRKTMHYSERTFMPISEEIEYLTLYLNMEKLRFKSRFHFLIVAEEEVNTNLKIPSLLIQPFVENAIKHGIEKLTGQMGFIEVIFKHEGSRLCILVRDNGVGIKSQLGSGARLNSFGIKLSQKRIDSFKQLFNADIHLDIKDLSEMGGQGTEIKLYINIT